MEKLRRVDSPMEVFDENADLKRDEIERQKRILEVKQRTRSPFFVGSIEKVNKKISKLDRKLQRYTELVVESRASDVDDIDATSVSSARGRDRYQKRERETKEVNKFAGYFSMKQTLVPGRSERVKHISKVSLHPSKTAIVKKDSGKPKFVELHQYPGYDHAEISPLPDDIPARDMLKKAVDAHVQLHMKPQYRPDFEKWLYSDLSVAVFLDMFWYFFLSKYQSSKNSQIKLFNRTAHNYVKLMWYVKNPVYKDVFFKDYPLLVSQAVYAAFCHCFPDSYKQFGEPFKEELVSLVYMWIAGIQPTPRMWMSWNLEKLEPANIKTREEMANTKKNKQSSAALNLDYLDSLFSSNMSNASQFTSMTSLNQSASKSSVNSWTGRHKKYGLNRKRSSQTGLSKFHNASPSSSNEGVLIDQVADSQSNSEVRARAGTGFGGKKIDARKVTDALTPIRELTREDEEEVTQTKASNASIMIAKNAVNKGLSDKVDRESHPACKGPKFTRSVFNINGQSPLVAHYFRMKELTNDAGQVVYVQRTQLEDLPSLDAPTYKDIIKESFQRVREIEKEYNQFYERTTKAALVSSRKHKRLIQEHQKLQASLLAKPKQVKRLCELLILEQKKDKDSVSVGADAAVESALQACS